MDERPGPESRAPSRAGASRAGRGALRLLRVHDRHARGLEPRAPCGVPRRTAGDAKGVAAEAILALLRGIGQSVHTIAESMAITPDFLVDLSENGSVLPLSARQELVRRAKVVRALDETDAIASFDVVSLQRAASRDTAYPVSHLTYEKLVKRSSLSAEQKRFWLGLA